ncbi:hypothetical protein LOTGIDRAFT_203482 [Lottia gigantea]|uniref:ATP synthase subunit d, mitochondrial n=1 Tax=Lottia gigantea TaxID=225164 RepID=V4CH20_LOTGI|nr:hypothetical protein LOTGIDRAFT_203482 [Lottia gigantea]ESP01380.1 hypothetical protein LOTGIDRAFT_203482 [Lottia gigantea]
MASTAVRRVGKSVVDWAAFKERVPQNQIDPFRVLKQRSDIYVNRVNKYPESLPKIDFTFYRNALGALPMIDQFEKSYSSIEVPYPKDKDNVIKALEEQEKLSAEKREQFKKEMVEKTKISQYVLDNIHLVPPPEEMNIEMYYYFFPERAIDPENRPTVFPHTKSAQPDGNEGNVIHNSELHALSSFEKTSS